MKLFVINLESGSDRRERITKRLEFHGVLRDTTFVNAYTPHDPLVKSYSAGCDKRSEIQEHACFLSHLKALRTFVDSKELQGVILEDDAMLHNYFFARFHRVQKYIERGIQLIMLCHINRTWDGLTLRENIGDLSVYDIAETTFGAQAYWITREYALLCLSKLDKPIRDIPERFVTSELITRMSNGIFLNPPLVVEEAVYSNLRRGDDLNIHRRYMGYYDYENYSNAEEIPIKELWN